jgi:hypothetical protein
MEDKKFARPSQLNRYLMMDSGMDATGWLKEMGAADVLRRGYRKGDLDPSTDQQAKITPKQVIINETRQHPIKRKSDDKS